MEIKNPNHQAWFDTCLNTELTPTEAYMKVYPNASKATAKVESCRLHKKYADGLYKAVTGKLSSTSLKAVKVLDSLLADRVPEAVRLKAAIAVLDYNGHKAAEKKEITINDMSESERDARLKQLLKSESIDADLV